MPPKSNKLQGCRLESWPEAPVCSWEQTRTLGDPSAIWDKEHTDKRWISKQRGELFDTRGNTVLIQMLSFLSRALWVFCYLQQPLVQTNYTVQKERHAILFGGFCLNRFTLNSYCSVLQGFSLAPVIASLLWLVSLSHKNEAVVTFHKSISSSVAPYELPTR